MRLQAKPASHRQHNMMQTSRLVSRVLTHPRHHRLLPHSSSLHKRFIAQAQDPLSSSEYGIDELPASYPTPPPPTPGPGNKESIKQALQQGTLGIGLSAGGFLYCYHLGILWELARLGILPPPGSPGSIKMAGASAGSLAIATYACGLDVDKATTALLEFAANCRTNGTMGRLSILLRDFLHAYLPDDAPERCHDQTYVAVTRVFPVWRHEVVHRFHNKDDLVEALITSCHIPYYANGQWMTKFRGRYYMDGGVAAFIPAPPTPTVVKVCCFPVSEVLNMVKPTVQNYQRVASLLDVSISPDAFEAWPYNYQQLLNWALLPAEDDTLKSLIAKGRRDALAWATSLDLVSPEEQRQEAADARQQAGGGVLLGPSGRPLNTEPRQQVDAEVRQEVEAEVRQQVEQAAAQADAQQGEQESRQEDDQPKADASSAGQRSSPELITADKLR